MADRFLSKCLLGRFSVQRLKHEGLSTPIYLSVKLKLSWRRILLLPVFNSSKKTQRRRAGNIRRFAFLRIDLEAHVLRWGCRRMSACAVGSVVVFHELNITAFEAPDAEVVAECLAKREAAKLYTAAEGDSRRHLHAVDVDRDFGR